jgi:NYN domain
LGSRATIVREGGPCFFPLLVRAVKLNIYVDAFNLYYGSLVGTAYKWLDLLTFFNATFPNDQIHRIRYFTARIKPNPHDSAKHARQATYLRALQTLPNLTIHEGSYLKKSVKMPLHPIPAPPTLPTIVKVVKTEEKGSDVNLASYLLLDAFDEDCEGSVVVSNDSDLAEPFRIVRTRFKPRMIVLHPCSVPGRYPSIELRKAAALRAGKPSLIVQDSLLAASQFPPSLTDPHGTFTKPAHW